MKICVTNGGVPADYHVAADAHLQFAEQHRIGKVAIVADDYAAPLAEVEMHPFHGAMGADDQGLRRQAVKALEGKVVGQDGVEAKPDVGWEFAFGPAARRQVGW